MSNTFATVIQLQQAAASDSVSTYSPARARAREADMAIIRDYYRDTFGLRCPPVAERDIDRFLDAGITAEVVKICIDEAALAPRPSWAYARAILRRLMNEGVRTAQEYTKRQTDWLVKTGKWDLF